MTRRTKIVCTLGPSSSDKATIRALIEAGMDVARLNFSHGSHADHRRVIECVREEAARAGRVVPILQDLQGPKIRIGKVKGDVVLLREGQTLVLTSEPMEESTAERVYVSYPTLAQDTEVGGHILLDDGQLELEIVEKRKSEVVTKVVVGGPLRSRKGVNLPNIRTSTPSLTEKDLEDLEFGLSVGVDLIALSFVRDEADVTDLIRRVRESGRRVGVIAKIEKPEAVERIDQILAKADGIMVARGDLGIEMRLSKVPGAQKRIIKKCLAAAKPAITATQMLESMIENPRPTRAEVSDVANAVLDGSDALMLSGETAVGKYPVRVVEVMDQIIREAERHYGQIIEHLPDMRASFDVTDAVSYTAYQLAGQVGAVAIACLTASGATARAIARHRPRVPVYAFTDDERVVGQLGLTWGTKAFAIPFQRDTDEGVACVHRVLVEHDLARPGDLIVITAGMPLPAKGRTNMVHVSRI
ncbi:pyruvate kinase [Rhodocaloribacter litoris]|uniref:pyruvate kinase n=1 Tax=Rhodocaloribacter litoris TaxID=2558931 RepID=UPI00141E2A1B|nr:pyruvate kinase [Rhodocaloribacter litoris]QXD16740.1 pyruvate kinase [Rhodocaloribacter litoris]GIV59260.1 MAG: pyruvate kinase [Rhodothermaceae bacterium]